MGRKTFANAVALVLNVAIQEAIPGMKETHPRTLLFSPFFFPERISTGKANTHLAQALAAQGARVMVVCSHPLYPDWVPVWSNAPMAGVTVLRGGGWVRYPRRLALRRIVLEAWFAAYAAWCAWQLRKQAEIAIGVFPPSLFALCTHLFLPRRTCRIAIVHDLQGVLAGQRGTLARRMISRLVHVVESRAFRQQALCIFFSTDMAKEAQSAYGLEAERVAVQYPFVTIGNTSGLAAETGRLQAVLPSEQVHVVYSGALGEKQNSRQFVAFLQLAARKFPSVQFHLFSGGPVFEQLRALYEDLPGPRTHFHPLVEERDLPELYARSTIQMVPQAEKTETGALPSKLPNLLAAGAYIFAITSPESEVARLLREAETGTVVERWEEALFLHKLEDALREAQETSAAARRQQAQPLLGRFAVENLVNLVFAAAQAQREGKAWDPRAV
jgi:glycosyltransferase involved in cell wall biosynthesis